jgi:3-hydroxyacyl-[acyl-carrier-protein] dehydratase
MATNLADLEHTLRRARREPLWAPGPDTRDLDVRGAGLESLIRHRPPFLLLHGITAIDTQQETLAGRARIDPADPVLRGHFPGEPIYPGALLMEMLAQLMACYRPLAVQVPPERAFGTNFRGVFLRPVVPDDELELLGMQVGTFDGLYSRGVGQVRRGDEICALAVIEAVLV